MNENSNSVSSLQEEYIFQTFPLIHKTIFYKLGALHRDSVEDLKQKVFLKLWRWKTTRSEKELSNEEWQKMANVTARNEVTRFFSEKYTRDILFSQMDEETQKEVFSTQSFENILEGNSASEINSLIGAIWKSAQILTLRQKYAFILQHPNLVMEFIVCGYCSIKELAAYFEATEDEISDIMDVFPISEQKIGELLEKKLGEKLSPNKIWEARSKAKARLANALKDRITNERLSVSRGT